MDIVRVQNISMRKSGEHPNKTRIVAGRHQRNNYTVLIIKYYKTKDEDPETR